MDGRSVQWLETYRARNRSADSWARGYELVRHHFDTQERVFRMAEQLAARHISGNGFPVFEVLAAADQLASSAMALILQETCTQANPSTGGSGVTSAKGVPIHATSALNMVPAYVGYLSINALTGRTRPWVMEGEAAVDAVDRLRAAVADAHLPSGDFLGVADPASQGSPASRPPLVAFLSDGAFAARKLSALTERWRRGGGKAVTPILLNDGSWIRRFVSSQSARIEQFVTSLRHDGFDPIVVDGRDPAAITWAIFEIECRLAAAADARPCSCHPSEKLVPCAVAVELAAAGPHEGWRDLMPQQTPVVAVTRRTTPRLEIPLPQAADDRGPAPPPRAPGSSRQAFDEAPPRLQRARHEFRLTSE
jgi:hypothetical protein